MTEIALSMFHRAATNSQGTNDLPNKPVAGGLNVHRAVDLSVSWVHHVYDLWVVIHESVYVYAVYKIR